MRKFAVGTALLVGVLGIASGTVGIAGGAARADPPPEGTTVRTPVVPDHQVAEHDGQRFTIDRDGGSVVVASRDAAFHVVGGAVEVDDAHGAVIASLPLSYRKDNLRYPIAAQIDGHAVRMTPALSGGTPVGHPIAGDALAHAENVTAVAARGGPVAGDPIAESFTPRDAQALSAFSTRAWLASFTGSVVGAIVGAGVGCLAGAAVGSVSTAITTLFLGVLPGAVIGCIAGVALLGSVGTLLGAVAVAGPIGLWSAYQYFDTIRSPCRTPGAFCNDPAHPVAPPPAKK